MDLSAQKYSPPFIFRQGHFNTIIPNLFRRVNDVKYSRQRINTPDGDFIDLDFSKTGSRSIGIVLHGLEGSSERAYIKGMIKALNENSYDAVAFNQRSCSGETNLLYSSYHSGKTDDLDTVVKYLLDNSGYNKIILIGYSLGGNIVLKYLGEKGENVNSYIKSAVAVSVPCQLKDSAFRINKGLNKIYMKRFIISLRKKLVIKKQMFPDAPITLHQIKSAFDFTGFDNLYTAPAHGFKDANEYWAKNSSKQFIPSIKIPSLIINAKDDPFLPASCYPVEEAKNNPDVHLMMPEFGGHVGFSTRLNLKGHLWCDEMVIRFLDFYNT